MPDLPPALAEILVRLSPERQQEFLAILQYASDEESLRRELATHPELLAVLQGVASSGQSDNPAELQTILQELYQPPRSLLDMPRRIDLCRRALALIGREENTELWGFLQAELANSLAENPQSSRPENLAQAIEHYNQALEVYTREAYPEDWAMIQNNLGNAYRNRITGERAENIERAIHHFEQALEVRTREAYPEQWAMTQNNLAVAYLSRIRGERAENLEQAIAHSNQALEVSTREAYPEDWAGTQNNLAVAYLSRIRGERAENLERAIAHADQALEVQTRQAYPEAWALTQDGLATAYAQRLEGERAENVEQAIGHYEQALEVFTRQAYPERWAATQNNLAIAYSTRIRGDRAKNIEQAIAHYAQALEVRRLERRPADYQVTQRSLGHLYFGEKRWSEALTAYREAIRAEKVLLAAAYTEAGRLAETAQTSELYARATYALSKLSRVGDALGQLEQGKARLLSSALALDELDLSLLPAGQQETLRSVRQTIRSLETEMHRYLGPDTPALRNMRARIDIGGRTITLAEILEHARVNLNASIERVRQAHPGFMQEGLELGEILALIPKDSALVAPAITSQGSAVFVVPAGMQSVGPEEVLWLDDFKDVDLQTILLGPAQEEQWGHRLGTGGWLGAYFNARTNAKAWLDTIETTGQALWDRLMGPIAERLATLHARNVLLMPQGGLGLLPLHAAWREIDGRRRYFLDEYTISYMPSAYARRVSEERLRDAQGRACTLLAVINPTEDLPFTPSEGEQVSGLFGDKSSTVLRGSRATPEAVKQGIASYLHFACHGFYQWLDPMQSGLRLAKGEPLTLAKIIGRLNLEATRLVTLSACETGITDIRQSPDEYLGLPAGFLLAGGPAVVSTLWAVNDLSTPLLMERFYQLHLHEGQDIPVALRQAQIWLRDVCAGQLNKRFREEEAALLGNARMPIETASAYFTRFVTDPADRPFAHPYYWAAFTFSGA